MPDESKISAILAAHPYDRITDVPAFVSHMGAAIHQSGFFGCVNEAQGRVIALDCLVKKIPPLERAATDHIIEGKLSMRSDAMLAQFLKRGGKIKWENTGDDGIEAKATFTSRDGTKLSVSYTTEMARTAGLIKDKPGSNWNKNRPEMLRARLISKAVRMVDPEVVAGRYTPEELDPDSRESHTEATYVPVENTEGTKPLQLPTNPPPTPQQTSTPATPAAVEPSSIPSLDASQPMITVHQLAQLRPLKAELQIPDEKWREVLQKNYGVTTAKDLTEQQAAKFLANLERKVQQKQMNDWAAKVQSTPAPAGATTLPDQPPFESGGPGQQT